jgi:hypothetical protein
VLRVLIHAQLEHIRTCVVADNVEVVLPAWNVLEVELREEGRLLVEARTREHAPERIDDPRTSAHQDRIGFLGNLVRDLESGAFHRK